MCQSLRRPRPTPPDIGSWRAGAWHVPGAPDHLWPWTGSPTQDCPRVSRRHGRERSEPHSGTCREAIFLPTNLRIRPSCTAAPSGQQVGVSDPRRVQSSDFSGQTLCSAGLPLDERQGVAGCSGLRWHPVSQAIPCLSLGHGSLPTRSDCPGACALGRVSVRKASRENGVQRGRHLSAETRGDHERAGEEWRGDRRARKGKEGPAGSAPGQIYYLQGTNCWEHITAGNPLSAHRRPQRKPHPGGTGNKSSS